MCENCGCTSNQPIRKIGAAELHLHARDHSHSHGHDHFHEHEHGDGHYHSHPEDDILVMEAHKQNLLQANRNRGMFEAKSIFAIKIASSQGSGKSMIIEKSIELLTNICNLFVIEDNQNTSLDITGAKTINANVGFAIRLNAEKIFKAVKSNEVKDKSILFIENLADVCSTDGSNDLGENRSVVVFSVTEGDNKPAKYPELFAGADVCLINKIDLLPYVDFDIKKAKNTILALNPGIKFFEISAKTGEGIAQWIRWVGEEYRRMCQ